MERDKLILRVLAVLIALRAVTNVLKPFGVGTGLVFFGALLGRAGTAILSPLLGIYMLVYARGMWSLRRYAVPMGIAYAAFVLCNILLFPVVHGLTGVLSAAQYAAFGLFAVATTSGAVWLLRRRRDELR